MNDKDRKLIDRINKFRTNNLPGKQAVNYGCVVTITGINSPAIRIIKSLEIDLHTGSATFQCTDKPEDAYIFDSRIAKTLCSLLPCLGAAKEVNIYPVQK